jgi:hypothetical protein
VLDDRTLLRSPTSGAFSTQFAAAFGAQALTVCAVRLTRQRDDLAAWRQRR